jgi:hypothetical protein
MGVSTALVIFRQNDRPSLFETFHPLVTFHSCFNSSVDDGFGVTGTSWIPLGKLPTVGGALSGLLMFPLPLEYWGLLMTCRGICVGLACVGKYCCLSSGTSGLYRGNMDLIMGSPVDGPALSLVNLGFAIEL